MMSNLEGNRRLYARLPPNVQPRCSPNIVSAFRPMEQNLKRGGHTHHHGFKTSAHPASTRQLSQSTQPGIEGGAQSAKPDLRIDVQRLKAKPEICEPTCSAVRGPMHGEIRDALYCCNSTSLELYQSADSGITMGLAVSTAARCKTRILVSFKQLSLSCFLHVQVSWIPTAEA
jgi:hypothetical protein